MCLGVNVRVQCIEVASTSYLNRIGIHKGVCWRSLGKGKEGGKWRVSGATGEGGKWRRGGEEEDRQGEDGRPQPLQYTVFLGRPLSFSESGKRVWRVRGQAKRWQVLALV